MGDIDVSSVKIAFETASRFSEWSTIAVAVGVFIELLALLIFSKEMPPLEKKVMVFATLLIVAGCCGEFIFGSRAGDAAAQLQAAQNAAVQSAKTEAAKASDSAAQAIERAALVQQAAAWRILDRDQAEKLKTSLAGVAKRSITVGFAVGDPETISFAIQLINLLTADNWEVSAVGHWYESQLVPGVRVIGADSEGKSILKTALTSAQIPFSADPVPIPGMYNGGPPLPDETKLFLYVGTKPAPKF
jgi:hypothetical protein